MDGSLLVEEKKVSTWTKMNRRKKTKERETGSEKNMSRWHATQHTKLFDFFFFVLRYAGYGSFFSSIRSLFFVYVAFDSVCFFFLFSDFNTSLPIVPVSSFRIFLFRFVIIREQLLAVHKPIQGGRYSRTATRNVPIKDITEQIVFLYGELSEIEQGPWLNVRCDESKHKSMHVYLSECV